MDELKIYKFIVPSGTWVQDPEDPTLSYRNIAAAAVATSPAEARKIIEGYAAARGHDVRWLRVAQVREIPITPSTFIMWAQG